jgi:hypothetical protein
MLDNKPSVELEVAEDFGNWEYNRQSDFLESQVGKGWSEWTTIFQVVSCPPDPYTLMMALSQVRTTPPNND